MLLGGTWSGVGHALIYAGVSVIVAVTIGLIAAVWFDRKGWLRAPAPDPS